MVKVSEKLCKTGTLPRSGRKLGGFRGITWHETGNTSATATAKSHADYVFNLKEEKSWHYCVDANEAWRSIPENEVAWCNGDGKTANGGNMTTLSLEICINNGGDFGRAKDNACWLTADIFKRHGIKKAVRKENIFIHHDWSGKDCPHNIRATPGELDRMIKAVNTYLDEMWGTVTAPKPAPAPAPVPTPAPAVKKILLKPGTWNVRNAPNMLGKVVKIVKGGTEIAYTGMSGKWYKVDGGYIGPSAVKK